MWRILRLLVIGAIVAAVVMSRPQKDTVSEGDDSDESAGGELARFITAINTVNSEDDEEYVSALRGLQEAPDQAIAEARRLLTGPSNASFGLRHSTLLALKALRSEASLDLLSEVALNPQPLPPKENPDAGMGHHGFEEAIRGEMLALDAIDGLEALADVGSSEAVARLVRAASVPSNSIRAAALTALSARPERRKAFDQAVSALPRELRHLAQMRRVPVEEVPQIGDPRIHLADHGVSSRAAPQLPRERGEHGAEAPARGAPAANRS